jgi:signal transduction histidine kinase
MAAAVEHATRILSALATKENVRVIHDFKDACPVLILEDDLHQIVFNLLENGIKYNKPGGTLTVSLYRDDDSAVMKVTDTGVGIPEDALPHIFKRFYRVDKARSRKTGGSGLGLSIVHSIVEQNNGSIAISSEIGVGTTFTVTFPLFDTENIVP